MKVKPRKAPYTHWMTFDFVERKPSEATVALRWDELEVPIRVEVPDVDGLYLAEIRKQLRNATGFDWQSWEQAAQFCLQRKTNLPRRWGVGRARRDAGLHGAGELPDPLDALAGAGCERHGRRRERDDAEGDGPSERGLVDLHMYARGLQAQKKTDEAVAVYLLNAKKHPGQWPVDVGLARAYSAQGKLKEALAAARKALAQAPDDVNRKGLQSMIEKLSAGKAID